MKGHVVFHEGGHEKVAVIIPRLQAQDDLLASLGCGSGKGFGTQQVDELVIRALIDEDRAIKAFSAISREASCASHVVASSPR